MKILITGGSGYLGRGLLRFFTPCDSVTVYSRDEHKQDICRQQWPNVNYILGDINDYDRLMSSMTGHDVVIHTAAIKYIPEAEHNVSECIKINVGGSENVFRAALRAGVKKVVAVSTDKAVSPLNVYGMTKALMERLVGEYARLSGGRTEYTACRYGNVVGSTGSVIPLFQRQAREGVITVTDPDMTRYWLGIKDAVKLVDMCIQGAVDSGSVLIPQPAAMRMIDLAELIANNYALDILTRQQPRIEIIGKRPGEKIDELLLTPSESVRAAYHRDRDQPYYELYPTWHAAVSEPFILTSNTPQVWLSNNEMLKLIRDSVVA